MQSDVCQVVVTLYLIVTGSFTQEEALGWVLEAGKELA